MRRVSLAATLASVALVASTCGGCDTQQRATEIVYGDSLTVNSTDEIHSEGVAASGHAGKAVCDFQDEIMGDARAGLYRSVVIETVGNWYTPCTGGTYDSPSEQRWSALFLSVGALSRDLTARGIKVTWATAPAPEPGKYPAIDPARVKGIFDYWAHFYPVRVADTGNAVTPGGVFTWQVNGATVRLPDGVHLTPEGGKLFGRALVGAGQ